MQGLGIKLTLNEMQGLMAKLDINKDGCITEVELHKVL